MLLWLQVDLDPIGDFLSAWEVAKIGFRHAQAHRLVGDLPAAHELITHVVNLQLNDPSIIREDSLIREMILAEEMEGLAVVS